MLKNYLKNIIIKIMPTNILAFYNNIFFVQYNLLKSSYVAIIKEYIRFISK